MRLRHWVIVLALSLAGTLSACPTCKDAFGNSPQTAGLARGFYVSIFVMLGMVFTLVGLLIVKIVKEARNEPPSTPAA